LPSLLQWNTIKQGVLMSTETSYKWLEPKPYKKHTRQLGIKGRNMLVWNLVAPIVVNNHAPEAVAEDYRLPLEVVQEALDYYSANKEWIDAEVDQVGRELRCEINRGLEQLDAGQSRPFDREAVQRIIARARQTHR
jgi:uncharacterized protein (DUF433 family)